MTKDQVIASLANALDKIDSEDAKQAMADMFQQIQQKQLPQPGPETSAILMKAFMANLKVSGKPTMAPGMRGATAPGEQTIEESLAESASDIIAPTQITDDDLKMIEDLQARFLIATKRRAKKVAALNALAQRKIAPALKAMIPLVADICVSIDTGAQRIVVNPPEGLIELNEPGAG